MTKHKCVNMLCPMIAFSFVLLAVPLVASEKTVEQKLAEDPELSQFHALISNDEYAKFMLNSRAATLFAPTNKAFQKLPPNIKPNVMYHITNAPLNLGQLNQIVSTEMEGNPPLWITRKHEKHHDDIYINNAKIDKDKSDYKATNKDGKLQILHTIDEVLIPLTQKSNSGQIYNPDAFMFLNQTEMFDVGPHRLWIYRERVTQTHKQLVYKAHGSYTFFIPVEEGFKPNTRPNLIDAKVIDGHVIPNNVLFIRPTPKEKEYETLAFSDNVKITIGFSTSENKGVSTFVKSNTILGDSKLVPGFVLAEIVKANIPVSNGVVHLIARPLIVVDTDVAAFLKEQENGQLYRFYDVIMNSGSKFIEKINRLENVTLFAPSNEAWSDPSLKNIIADKRRLSEILDLHLVGDRLPVEKIIKENRNTVPTQVPGKNLYFNIFNDGTNQSFTVEGSGVNATVIQSNIAATDGIVHIIDRVLGVPYQTILEKLRTDPMLNDTYFLGQRERFNDQLNDTSRMFTYFVPRDKAWHDAEIEFPSTHKKLFMKDFSYHARSILERHLVIADYPYTINELKLKANQTNGEILLPTLRDQLKIHIRENSKNYQVEWQGQWITIVRPDVQCTNGVIHVIDKPFLRESDVQVNGSPSASLFGLHNFISHLVMILVAKWLLL